MRITSNTNFRITVVLLIATIILIAFFSVGLARLKGQTGSTQDSWIEYSERSEALLGSISTLDRALGYGGFIHQFKNYVLRREESYRVRCHANLASARSALSDLALMIDEPDIAEHVGIIRTTVEQYADKLALVEKTPTGRGPQIIDELVRVDDDPALKSLAALSDYSIELLAAQKRASEQAAAETQTLLDLGYVIAFVMAAGGVIIIAFARTVEVDGAAKLVSAQQVDALFEDSPDGLLIVNGAGQIERVNSATVSLFGYDDANDMIGRSVDTLVPHDHAHMHRDRRAGYLRAPEPRKMQSEAGLRGLRKDGKTIPLDIALNQLPTLNETVTLVSCRDTTEAERSKHRLELALQTAKDLGEAKTRFLATMSHELRTPLNAVIGFSSMLQDSSKSLSKSAREHVGYIHSSGQHLLAMVNDILDFAKSTDGDLRIESHPISVHTLSRDVQGIFSPEAEAKNLKLDFKIADDVPTSVRGDETRIRQVLINLVSNAIKFTKIGSVTVDIFVAPVADEEDGFTLHLKVTDTGIGISADQQKNIFSPFTQADDSITRKFGGTGLGLAITRRLTRLMDGDITLDSEQGKGSCFEATLRVLRHTSAFEDDVEPMFDETDYTDGFTGKHILVVDDVALNAQLVKSVLEPKGVQVTWFDNGSEAIEFLADSAVDGVLMDLRMPKMNGAEATQIWRRKEPELSAYRVPIYAWSADVLDDLFKDKDLWDGALAKPTIPDDLLSLIRKCPRRPTQHAAQ